MEERYLYKAKRLDNGEWVTGSLITCEDGTYKIATSYLDGDTNIAILICAYEVDRDTICQCTGLKDKNSNLIWENDIVEIVSSPKRSYKYLIWWNREMSLTDAVPLDGIDFNGHDYWNGNYPNFHYETFCAMMQDPWGDFSDIKVIGNIFDNPELLEK